MSEVPPINDVPPVAPAPSFKDRRTGLIIFGILQILLGCLALLMIAAMLAAQAMMARSTASPVDLRQMLYVLVFYLAQAAFFISVGIGSTLCRRWARALTLVVAWPWLATGFLTLPIMAIIMPKVMAATQPQGTAIPPGVLKMILVMQLLMIGIGFIVIPGVLVLFYSRRDVKATCESRDPVSRWTDTAPLPVLGVALILWVGALFFPFIGIGYRGAMPLFGTIVSGLTGTLVALAAAALWFWMGLLWYRRKIIGWWVLLVTLVVFGISHAITFARIDLMELFSKMGYPAAQMEVMRQVAGAMHGLMTWGSVIWLVPSVVYLVWVKRFFRPVSG
jgi:hypothetical protein